MSYFVELFHYDTETYREMPPRFSTLQEAELFAAMLIDNDYGRNSNGTYGEFTGYRVGCSKQRANFVFADGQALPRDWRA